jgi:two-component system LytT family response regulator
MSAPPIRTLIADDEPAGREGISHLLRDDPDVVVASVCATGREAAAAIVAQTPDLVFLDVQMPELDGFGVLRAVGRERLPAVVFVTAYDSYALRAFDVHAVDYLLKPFTDERFREALERAKRLVRQERLSEMSGRLALLLDTYVAAPPAGPPATAAGPYLERLVIKSGGRVTLLRAADIEWIDADGDYVRIHVGKTWHLLRETMKHLEAQLDPARFVRIHRSTIVNLERIRELQPFFRGEYVVVLHSGVTLKLSRGYRDHLETTLGKSF